MISLLEIAEKTDCGNRTTGDDPEVEGVNDVAPDPIAIGEDL